MKNESGMSKLLKAVNDQAKNISNKDLISQLMSILDKHSEVSIQEAVYRILSLPMTKSSIGVKYLSTIHPHFRDGLLRADIDSLEENESVFHKSPHQYFESRHLDCIAGVKYSEIEKQKGYWTGLTLAEFWSSYDLVYGQNSKDEDGKFKFIPLKNSNACIRRRKEKCILRYYLNHNNDEDLARGLLILFHPFTNEIEEIHEQNVIELYNLNKESIESKRHIFEQHKILTEVINSIEKNKEKTGGDEPNNDDFEDIETTTVEEIESFEMWAKSQATASLKKHEELTKLTQLVDLREIIINLNEEQRLIFDDYCEHLISENDAPINLYIGGAVKVADGNCKTFDSEIWT